MIILASSSPRRSELLRNCGLQFEIKVADCDETPLSTETPEEMVKRLALAKASVIAKNNPKAFVIGADTTVVINNQILGKPEDHKDAFRMLSLIQGRQHEVWGGFAILCLDKKIEHVESHSTNVQMASMTEAEIKNYIDTKEPMDKAGSYAIQGIGLQFVDSIEGSYSNVVGLNLSAIMRALKLLGATE